MFKIGRKEKVELLDPSIAMKLDSVSYTYEKGTSNEKQAVTDFSFEFQKGKIYSIIGNSGSGKSTLIQHFNGLIIPTKGTVNVDNFIISSKNKKVKRVSEIRKKCGLVFQFPEYQLFKDTIEKDIMFGPLALKSGKTKNQKKVEFIDQCRKRAKKYLNLLGMGDEYLKRSPFGLSGGQKRRVAIAGILAIETDIIAFDEPTAGLDPDGEHEMINIIKDLKKAGKTVIVVTHNMDHVLNISDSVLVIDEGKLIKSGTPYSIFTDQRIIERCSLVKPLIISLIENIIKRDSKYASLMQAQPTTTEQLVDLIAMIRNDEVVQVKEAESISKKMTSAVNKIKDKIIGKDKGK
jgi:energy-coupling factor transport system ATP-binding protein